MSKKNVLRVLLGVFLIRLAFALLPSFSIDMGAWLAWADRLADAGPKHFYSDAVWTQYTPGFLYWLWGVGKIGWVHPLSIKIPVIIADLITGCLIWRVVNKTDRRIANFTFLLYELNPVIIFDGSVWGQIDGILTLMMFLSTYILVEKNNSYLSLVVFGLAFLIKPQALAILPVLLVLTTVRYGVKKMITSGLAGILVIILGFYPFFPDNPLSGLWDLIQKMSVSYSYTSLYAFNFWSYLGMWKSDSTLWMGISYFMWGGVAMMSAFGLLIIKYRNYLKHGGETYLLFALSCFIFFLFPTRVHERYLFPMFAYLIAYAGIKKQKSLFIVVGIAILVYTCNLYFPYSYYEQVSNPLKNISLENLIQRLTPILSFIQITIFAMLLFWNKLYFQLGKRANKVSQ